MTTPTLFDEPGAHAAPGPVEPDYATPAVAQPADVEHRAARRYRCESCAGQVGIPGRARVTLDDVRRIHDEACPGRWRGRHSKADNNKESQ